MVPQATETANSPEESARATHTNAFDFEKKTVLLNNGMEMLIIGIGAFTLSNEQAGESAYQFLPRGGRREEAFQEAYPSVAVVNALYPVYLLSKCPSKTTRKGI